MSQVSKFLFNLNDTAQGVHHVLPSGVALRVFFGEHVMLSVVDMGAEKYAPPHSHAEEQWGLCLEVSAVRIQGGEEFAVGPGDFWYTPGNMHDFLSHPLSQPTVVAAPSGTNASTDPHRQSPITER